MFFFGAGADIDVHAEIEAARAFVFIPDNQRDLTGGTAMNQNLGGSKHRGVRDARVGHRDALDLLGGVDEQRFVDHDAQRSRTLRLGRLRRKRGLSGGGRNCVPGAFESRALRQRLGRGGYWQNERREYNQHCDRCEKCRAKLHRVIPLHMRKPAMQPSRARASENYLCDYLGSSPLCSGNGTTVFLSPL